MQCDRISISNQGRIAVGSGNPNTEFVGIQVLPQLDTARIASVTDIEYSESKAIANWQCTDCVGQVCVVRAGEFAFDIEQSLTVTEDFSITSIAYRMHLQIANARILDSRYRLVEIGRVAQIDTWTPVALVGQIDDRYFQLVSVERPIQTVVRRTSANGLTLVSFLDHELAHPRFHFDFEKRRNWRSRYEFRAGAKLRCSFRLVVSHCSRPVVVPGRLPGRYQAAMTITDHADHDTSEKFRALLYGVEDGEVGNGRGFAGTQTAIYQVGLHGDGTAGWCRTS